MLRDVTVGGLHIHHLVYGIGLTLAAGFLEFRFQPGSPWFELLAIVFGIGAGLMLDEFALSLYMKDVYWADQGRKSVDAVLIALIVGGLFVIGTSPLDLEDSEDGSRLGLSLARCRELPLRRRGAAQEQARHRAPSGSSSRSSPSWGRCASRSRSSPWARAALHQTPRQDGARRGPLRAPVRGPDEPPEGPPRRRAEQARPPDRLGHTRRVTPEEMDRLEALLRVPSVSALPEHAPDMARAAAWSPTRSAAPAARRGGEPRAATRWWWGRSPASSGARDAPRVVLYGHYDVQPPGPAELWTSPPFEPAVRDGHLYARGASDDKGNLFMLIAAVQRLAAAGELPVRAAFVDRGEEESGGTSALEHFAADAEPALAALIFDSPMIGPARPSLCTGVRGMVYRRVRVRTAAADAHSGLYGGAALNAAHALLAILAAVAPRDGRLPEPLYAGVAPAGAAEVAAWADLPSGLEALAAAGLRPADAGAADGFYMRTLASPSLDVHGLAGGEPGPSRPTSRPRRRPRCRCGSRAGRTRRPSAAALDGLLRAAAPDGAEVDDRGPRPRAAGGPRRRRPGPRRRRRRAWRPPPAGARRRCASAERCR